MFEINDIILHPASGVCKIEDIREESFSKCDKKIYYVMHPINDHLKSTIFVPVDSEKVNLRAPLTEEEIIDMIEKSSDFAIKWIDNVHSRKTVFSQILYSEDNSKIISLIRKLNEKKEEVLEKGKKFSVIDEKILKDAEKKVGQEFSYSLSLNEEEVKDYILEHIVEV